MAQIEIDIKVEFHYEGEYHPEVTNALYENCYPAEYPDLIIDGIFDDVTGCEIKLTDDDEDKVINSIIEDELEPNEASFTFNFDCELDIDKTVSYNGQDVTEFVEDDYINELFS